MYLLKNGKIFKDFDLELLCEILTFIDDKIIVLSDQSIEENEADLWTFDRIENITGLGFVACQTYMASTYGCANIGKDRALLLGPKMTEKLTVAQLVNHAANFWKHNEEWQITGNFGPRKSMVNGFEEISYDVGSEYPLSGCLAELTNGSASFNDVMILLVKWRDDLIKSA